MTQMSTNSSQTALACIPSSTLELNVRGLCLESALALASELFLEATKGMYPIPVAHATNPRVQS